MIIALAVYLLVAHDYGYSREFSTCFILCWESSINDTLKNGVSSTLLYQNNQIRVTKYVNRTETNYPKYLQYLYHKLKNKARWVELAYQMNVCSDIPSDQLTNLNLHKIASFFKWGH